MAIEIECLSQATWSKTGAWEQSQEHSDPDGFPLIQHSALSSILKSMEIHVTSGMDGEMHAVNCADIYSTVCNPTHKDMHYYSSLSTIISPSFLVPSLL